MSASSVWRTPLTTLLGIELPILGAPMGGVAGPELAAAVSSAGGLGLLGHANLDLEEVRAQIRHTRSLTDRPFGIGLLFPSRAGAGELPPPSARRDIPLPPFLRALGEPDASVHEADNRRYDLDLAEQRLEIAIEERVPVLSCGLGVPAEVVARAHAAGMKVISLVGSRKAALAAAARGADVIVAQGHESGGHTGRTATLVLVPQVVDAVKVPVAAAGGISDGRGLAAALTLGAAGVLVGTRLIATPEARTAPVHKERIVAMIDDDTVVSRCYTGKPSRVIRNRFIDAWKGHEAEILPMPEQWEMVAPLVVPAKKRGEFDLANWPTGQGAVLVPTLKPAAQVVREMAEEAARLVHPSLVGGGR